MEKAASGHPGMPLGMADIAEVLWRKHLRHSPKNPKWFDRDRFVLSNGHGSMLLYSLLHLTGYDLTIQDLKDFRQLKSKTPGHPEFGITSGVETTTGPLGQGIANAVGMALAEKILANLLNSKKTNVIDHFTYCFLGDGCLMEGISHEAMSFAGVHELNKLICFYDSNGISIDGEISDWYKDDISLRCKAYGWNVIDNIDGHNREEIDEAISLSKKSKKPTMIVCKTHIGYGAGNKQDSESSHGAALGSEIVAELRENLDWPYSEFEIPNEIYIIKKGDTLSEIAQRFRISQGRLKYMNNSISDKIVVGQKLKIPREQRNPFKRSYLVKYGDTLSEIAQKYNTTTGELMFQNKLLKPGISVGQKLLIP